MVRRASIAAVLWFGLSTAQADWSKSTIWDQFFMEAEVKYELPTDILKAVAWRESRYDEEATGAAGEVGLMQLHPRWHRVPCTVAGQIDYAGAYLRRLIERTGSVSGGLASYNWGIGNVLSHRVWPESVAGYLEEVTGRISNN